MPGKHIADGVSAALFGCALVAAAGLIVCVGGPTLIAGEPLINRQASAAGSTDRFFTANGLHLHYLDWGTRGKRPFVMLHGLGRTAHSFDHLVPRYSRDYHVIALDRRGHGDSAWHPNGDYSVENDVKDLEVLVEQLGLKDIVITGNSTGGRVAQVYAALHPDNVAALIVEDVGPERPAEVAASARQISDAEVRGWATEDEVLQQVRSGTPRVSEQLDRDYVRHATRRRADGRLVWKRDPSFANTFGAVDLWPYVRRITSPTIYILGGDSAIVPPHTQERLKETIPNVEVLVLPKVGHYPHLETPDEFVRIVNRFLSQALSPSKPPR